MIRKAIQKEKREKAKMRH
jgi:hypothetical protein